MASLKDNVNNIADDTESLIKDHLKLFSVKQSERLALFLGVITSVFILSLLLLVLVVFCSFALASYLNDQLPGNHWGFWILAAFYLLVITLIIVKIAKTKVPPLSNFFAKFIVSVFNLDVNPPANIQGLKLESEKLKLKIETDKVKIKSNAEMLRYIMIESFFREFFGLFSSKKKRDESNDKDKD